MTDPQSAATVMKNPTRRISSMDLGSPIGELTRRSLLAGAVPIAVALSAASSESAEPSDERSASPTDAMTPHIRRYYEAARY